MASGHGHPSVAPGLGHRRGGAQCNQSVIDDVIDVDRASSLRLGASLRACPSRHADAGAARLRARSLDMSCQFRNSGAESFERHQKLWIEYEEEEAAIGDIVDYNFAPA